LCSAKLFLPLSFASPIHIIKLKINEKGNKAENPEKAADCFSYNQFFADSGLFGVSLFLDKGEGLRK